MTRHACSSIPTGGGARGSPHHAGEHKGKRTKKEGKELEETESEKDSNRAGLLGRQKARIPTPFQTNLEQQG